MNKQSKQYLETVINDRRDLINQVAKLTIENKELKEQLRIANVSKRFEIDFNGSLLCGLEITNNEPKIYGAVNGYGQGISPNDCKITEKQD